MAQHERASDRLSLAGHPLDLGASSKRGMFAYGIGGAYPQRMKFAAIIATLSLATSATPAEQRPPLRAPVPTAAIIMAQAGITFGGRDDLGPRYDPGSDRWETYQPPYGKVCRWVTRRVATVNGKVALQRQYVCGFKVPARQ